LFDLLQVDFNGYTIHEKKIPAERFEARQDSWFSCPHGNTQWAQSIERAPR
jgi:hypothetical protein